MLCDGTEHQCSQRHTAHGLECGQSCSEGVAARMSLLQQVRSIVIHGFRLAFFLSADRSAFNVSYAASAMVLTLFGCVLAGLQLSITGANETNDRLDALLELGAPILSAVVVAALGRALSRRLPLHMLFAAVAGTLPATDTAELLLKVMTWRLQVNLAKTPWPEGIAPAMFGYWALVILYVLLIAWYVLILYRSVQLIAGSPALGLTLAMVTILAAAFAIESMAT
jgi:hypothetical protein